jgi:hypothetical protein
MKELIKKTIITFIIISLSTPLWGGGRGISSKKVLTGKPCAKTLIASCRVTIRIPEGTGMIFRTNDVEKIYSLKKHVYHQRSSQSTSYFYKRIWVE